MKITGITLFVVVALFATTVVAQPKKPAPPKGLTCPVSGEAIKDLKKAPSVRYEGRTIYFCCKKCVGEFKANPAKYAPKQMVRCPLSGEVVKDPGKAQTAVYQGKVYYFCCPKCKPQFEKDPAKYAKQQKAASTPNQHHEEHSHSHSCGSKE